jgi:hypothetical protein
MLKNLNFQSKIVCLIILTVGLQQFPVIRVGGSFKVYELLAILLLVINLFGIKQIRFVSILKFYALGFFVLSPAISLLLSYTFLDYPTGFYNRYPDAESFKFNYWVFPVLQLIYMFFNYVVFYSIIEARKIFEIFNRLVKLIIWIGSGIAIYSLFAMFIMDVVAKLPGFLQNKQEFIMRSTGLSQEPSFYVLYQTWVVLFVFYSKQLFHKWTWILLLSLNVISLVFTFSTTLVALILIIGLSFFIFRNPLKIKLALLGCIAVSALVIYVILLNSSNWDYIETFFINKLTNFFSAPDHTMDSGSFRSFTARIGLAIFGEYPLFGVGVGNSIYYMYQFENKMGIVVFGERLFAGSFPQNAFSIVLSEQGVFGVLFFILLLAKMFMEFRKYRNYNNYSRMFFIGFLFNIAALMTIAPIYSLFIWVFPALGIGYINHRIKYEQVAD